MNKRALALLAAFAFAFVCAELGLPQGPTQAYAAKKQPGVSKPVLKLLTESQDLQKEGKWPEALAKAKEAQALPNRTPYDDFKINDVLTVIYINTQDFANAALTYEAAYQSGLGTPEERPTRLKTLAQIFYQIQNYPKSLEYADLYVKEVGDDLELLAIVTNIYLIQKDPKALTSAQDLIAKAELMGTKVQEVWWRLLLYSASDAKNDDGVRRALFGLVENYPNATNWNDLARYFSSRPQRTDHYGLLAFRLMKAADAMKTGEDYLYLAQFALNVGLPGEAKQALDAGKEKGLLPGGASTKPQDTALRSMAADAAKREAANLDADDAKAAASASGASDVAIGEALAIYGKTDKAVAAINRGLGKPTLRTRDEAQLALGWVHFIAGQYDRAKATFEAVSGEPRTTDMAKAWLILIKQKTSPAPAPTTTQ